MQRATPDADSRLGLLALLEDRACIAACGNSKESYERPAPDHREQYLHFKVRMAFGYLSSCPEEDLRVDTTHERQTNPKATPRIHARDKRAMSSAHGTLKGLETNLRPDFCVTSQKRKFSHQSISQIEVPRPFDNQVASARQQGKGDKATSELHDQKNETPLETMRKERAWFVFVDWHHSASIRLFDRKEIPTIQTLCQASRNSDNRFFFLSS